MATLKDVLTPEQVQVEMRHAKGGSAASVLALGFSHEELRRQLLAVLERAAEAAPTEHAGNLTPEQFADAIGKLVDVMQWHGTDSREKAGHALILHDRALRKQIAREAAPKEPFRDPLPYYRCRHCGCAWRNNLDGTMGLRWEQRSCDKCELASGDNREVFEIVWQAAPTNSEIVKHATVAVQIWESEDDDISDGTLDDVMGRLSEALKAAPTAEPERTCATCRLSYMQRRLFNTELVKEPTREEAEAAIARRLDAPREPIRLTGSCFILADVSIKCWLCGTMTTPSVAHRCEVE